LGEPLEFKKYQESAHGPAFYCNRPPSAASSIPATLFHPIFGQFVDDCETHVPTREDNAFAFALWSRLSPILDDEDGRATTFREIFQENNIIMSMTTIEHTKYRTDGDMHRNALRYLINEVKAEIGAKGAEPLFQAAWYYQEFCKHPAKKGIGVASPKIEVGA
jgi:hypothetical protein